MAFDIITSPPSKPELTNTDTTPTTNAEMQANLGKVFDGLLQLDEATQVRVRFSQAATQATTSSASKDFAGIPSWAKRVTVLLNGVSTNGSDQVIVQLGTAASFETSGYQGSSCYVNASVGGSQAFNIGTGVSLPLTTAPVTRGGSITFFLVDAATNTWAFQGVVGNSSSADLAFVSGNKALSSALTRLRLTTTGGTDTFDAGSVSILIEG